MAGSTIVRVRINNAYRPHFGDDARHAVKTRACAADTAGFCMDKPAGDRKNSTGVQCIIKERQTYADSTCLRAGSIFRALLQLSSITRRRVTTNRSFGRALGRGTVEMADWRVTQTVCPQFLTVREHNTQLHSTIILLSNTSAFLERCC